MADGSVGSRKMILLESIRLVASCGMQPHSPPPALPRRGIHQCTGGTQQHSHTDSQKPQRHDLPVLAALVCDGPLLLEKGRCDASAAMTAFVGAPSFPRVWAQRRHHWPASRTRQARTARSGSRRCPTTMRPSSSSRQIVVRSGQAKSTSGVASDTPAVVTIPRPLTIGVACPLVREIPLRAGPLGARMLCPMCSTPLDVAGSQRARAVPGFRLYRTALHWS